MLEWRKKGLNTTEKLPLSNVSAPKIMEFLKIKEQLIGTVFTEVPNVYTVGSGSSPMNLIHQSPSISLEIVQQGVHARFGTALADGDAIPEQPWISVALDPTNNNADEVKFYTWVHANVVVEIVKNFLTPNGWNYLMLQQHKFDFTDITGMKSYDGPTMLKVLLEEIDPTAPVNLELHRQAIEGAKLQEHKVNVISMYKSIERHIQAIVENGHAYDAETYRRHILDALLSGPNADFNTRMKSIKSYVDARYGYNASVTPATILMSEKQLYTNISRRNEWSKVDPRDAQILALTAELEKQPSKHSHGSSGYGGSKEETIPGMNTLKKWRTINKGPTLMKDGVNHHWCKHHVYEVCYDDLYYHNHTEATHEQWSAKKRGGQAAKTTGSSPAAPTPAV